MNRIIYWFRFVYIYKNWINILIKRILKTETKNIVLRNNITIQSDNNESLSVISDEIFVLGKYTRKFLAIKRGDVVVDIGAHIGIFSIYANICDALKIYAYEPDPENFNLLQKNTKANKIKNIIPSQYAVTDKVGNIDFYVHANSGGNSVYKQNLQNTKHIKVKSITIEKILADNKIDYVDFLKIDCEGSEGLIFLNIKPNILKRIKKIALEYHDNVSPLKHNQILIILKHNNFTTKLIQTDKTFGYILAEKI